MTNLNDGSRVVRNQRARERLARADIVPGFPEIIGKETQCRLCSLVEKDPATLRRVHEMFFGGKGLRALSAETAPVFEERGEKKLNMQCFARHFKSHVDFGAVTVGAALEDDFALPPPPPSRVAPETQPQPEPEPAPAPAPPPVVVEPGPAPAPMQMTVAAPTTVAAPAASPSIPEEDDAAMEAAAYFDMRNLVTKLRARLDQLDQSTAFVDDKGKVNSFGLQLWLRFVDSFRSVLEAMNRIRNNDKLTKAILQAHTKRNYNMASAPLVARIEVVLKKMEAGAPDTLDDLRQLARSDARGILEQAADDAIQETCGVYRLH